MEAPYVKELEHRRSATSFRNRRLEAEYRSHVARRSELNVRRQLGLGALMMLGLTILDFAFVSPSFAREAAVLRAAFIFPPILAHYGLTYVRRGLSVRQVAGVCVALAIGLTSLAIAELAGRLQEPMVAGSYFIVVVFSYFFLGLHYTTATLTTFSLVIAYVVLGFVTGTEKVALIYNGYSLFIMTLLCAIGAGQLELARRRDFLKERVLSYRADVDALSDLANRRAFDLHLAQSWDEAMDERAGIALMLIDIDHFKGYNDHYGHQAGDSAIQGVSRALKDVLKRPQDFASRYGGEEFAVILVDIDKDSALALAERVRAQVRGANIEHKASSADTCVTISIGVAHVHPHATKRSRKGLLQMADEALYSAKERGRNRVVDADEAMSATTGIFSLPTTAPRDSTPTSAGPPTLTETV